MKLKKGQLIVVRIINNAFLLEDEIREGSIGIFMGYPRGAKKYIPGLEPLRVLFGDTLVTVYMDEVEVL